MLLYGEGSSLEARISCAISDFQDDRAEYWKQNPENAFLDVVDGLADLIVSASHEFLAPSPNSQSLLNMLEGDFHGFRQIAESDGVRAEVLEKIQIAVAWRFSTDTDTKAQRCFDLAREVLDTKPGEPVLKFLRRLSRCYIAGFDPECVILCRSALENAVIDVFARHSVSLPATLKGKSAMKMRIEAAHKRKWLSPAARKHALDIWIRGSKAVHEDLDATRDVLGTLRATMLVLRELYASS